MFKKLQPFDESNFWKNTEKFIFIATQPGGKHQVDSTFMLFYSYRLLNAITIIPHNNFFRVFSYNPYLPGEIPMYEIDNMETNTTEIFKDKLKDLHGYEYKVLEYREAGFSMYHNFNFMALMCKVQNASIITKTKLNNSDKKFLKKYEDLMTMKKVDMTLNTGVKTTFNNAPLPSVITYDERAYCAMVPKPPRISFIALVLKPFDSWTWIALVVTVGSCAVVWRLYRFFYPDTGDSTWYFIFGVFAFYVGQALTFRQNRTKQVLLIQLCIMMTFILGNTYQSMMTTYMTESRDGIRLKTLDELMKSDYNFQVDPIFYDLIRDSKDFPQFELKMTKLPIFSEAINFLESAQKHIVYIAQCELADLYFENLKPNEGPADHYYMLPEKFYKSLSSFELSDDSPYQSFLQYYSDRVFESGIKLHWQSIYLKLKEFRAEIEQRYITNEEYLLKLEDLKGVFKIWFFCMLGCTLVFLLEVFTHDCLQNLTWKVAEKALYVNPKTKQKKKSKKRKMKVRFVQVHPMEIGDSMV
jgi:hypothetical protein